MEWRENPIKYELLCKELMAFPIKSFLLLLLKFHYPLVISHFTLSHRVPAKRIIGRESKSRTEKAECCLIN